MRSTVGCIKGDSAPRLFSSQDLTSINGLEYFWVYCAVQLRMISIFPFSSSTNYCERRSDGRPCPVRDVSSAILHQAKLPQPVGAWRANGRTNENMIDHDCISSMLSFGRSFRHLLSIPGTP